MKLIVLGLFFVMVLADELESQISKGQDAKDGQFPYQVQLVSKNEEDTWLCDGSLISQTWIVTAAHCLDGDPIENITAFLGSVCRSQGKERPARNIIIHPGWNRKHLVDGNDIGLITIDSVSYSDTIKSVDLPPLSNLDVTYEGHIAVASGWGLINDESFAHILQYTNFTVISNVVCSREYNEDLVIANISGGNSNESSIFLGGGSGGPLVDMDSKHLIGIDSLDIITICDSVHFAKGFTRVTSFRQWIYDNTGI